MISTDKPGLAQVCRRTLREAAVDPQPSMRHTKLTRSLNRPPFRPERKNWGAGLLQEKLGVYVPFFDCDTLLANQLLEGFSQLIEVER